MKARDYGPTGPVLTIDGVQVHAHIEGEGPPLILLHGASGNTRDFTFDLVGRLSDRFCVVAFDRPGHGHTGRMNQTGESPEEQARLLEKAAEQLGIGRAILVGNSYGMSVALAWALEYPDRVAGIVSLAGVAMPWTGALNPWYGMATSTLGSAIVLPLVSAFAPRRSIEGAVASIFAPQTIPDGYLDHVGLPLSTRTEALRANALQVDSLLGHVSRMAPRYPELTLPIHAVHGTADVIVPLDTHSRPLMETVPNGRLTALRGVGHMPHHAAPVTCVDAIEEVTTRAGLR